MIPQIINAFIVASHITNMGTDLSMEAGYSKIVDFSATVLLPPVQSSTHFLDPLADPIIDSNKPAFIDAVYALDAICENSDNFVLNELCVDIGKIVDPKGNICFDVLNYPSKTTMAGCEVTVAQNMAGEIYSLFNNSAAAVKITDPLSSNDYVFYKIEDKKFGFPIHKM